MSGARFLFFFGGFFGFCVKYTSGLLMYLWRVLFHHVNGITFICNDVFLPWYFSVLLNYKNTHSHTHDITSQNPSISYSIGHICVYEWVWIFVAPYEKRWAIRFNYAVCYNRNTSLGVRAIHLRIPIQMPNQQ